mmetsp:Transcript_5105/g.8864  ORF Transcript_5105/g.8864 Transcript_5105/m.8864 type:complete len:231 (+) Transcript_5105:684-1376(+)
MCRRRSGARLQHRAECHAGILDVPIRFSDVVPGSVCRLIDRTRAFHHPQGVGVPRCEGEARRQRLGPFCGQLLRLWLPGAFRSPPIAAPCLPPRHRPFPAPRLPGGWVAGVHRGGPQRRQRPLPPPPSGVRRRQPRLQHRRPPPDARHVSSHHLLRAGSDGAHYSAGVLPAAPVPPVPALSARGPVHAWAGHSAGRLGWVHHHFQQQSQKMSLFKECHPADSRIISIFGE